MVKPIQINNLFFIISHKILQDHEYQKFISNLEL